MNRRNDPSLMWDYALVHAAEVMQFIPRPRLWGPTGHAKKLQERRQIFRNTLILISGIWYGIGMVPIPALVMMTEN